MRFLVALGLALLPVQATAEPVGIGLELNRLVPSENGCSATFVVHNTGDTAVETYLLEAVIFDVEKRVDRLSLFDFGEIPAQARRVREFAIPSLECGRIGSVLVNGVAECAPAGGVCDQPPSLSSRLDVRLD